MELLCYVHRRQMSGTTQCNLVRSTKVEKKHHGAVTHREKKESKSKHNATL